jgi:hypothetical protein
VLIRAIRVKGSGTKTKELQTNPFPRYSNPFKGIQRLSKQFKGSGEINYFMAELDSLHRHLKLFKRF